MPDLRANHSTHAQHGASPLIVTGMHRSGTSLTASFLQTLGVNVGDRLYEADRANQKGYFEDVDFLEFQRHVLQASCNSNEPGWPDWGWTESEQLNKQNFANYQEEAQALIATRINSQAMWGWKDPRTTLMLDFWHNLLPEAQYVLVYRFPWDVADSILRLNEPIFIQHPEYALRTWHFYNQQLLDFYVRHRDRCILVSINGFLENTSRLLELMRDRLSFSLHEDDSKDATTNLYDANLFGSLDWQHPLVQLILRISPEYLSLLEELDRIADLPSNFHQSDESESILTSVLRLQQQILTSKLPHQNLRDTSKSAKDSNSDILMQIASKDRTDSGVVELSQELRAVLKDQPKLHKDRAGDLVSYQASEEVLSFIDQHVTENSRTLETGAGMSTILFAIRGSEHTCIVPSQGQIDRIKQYCHDHQISTDKIDFQLHNSEVILPVLNPKDLDLILIDGCHGFPIPFIDWFYATSYLKKDGTLIVDDTQLWTGAVLKEYLLSEPEWELIEDIEPRAAIFRKLQTEIRTKEWDEQPYVMQADSVFQTRSKIAEQLADQKTGAQLSLEKAELSLELERLRGEIVAMKTSKFWKLREAWFVVKRSLKLEA
jgi:Sulfotransferase family